MSPTARRPRLTAHQSDVLRHLSVLSTREYRCCDGWVPEHYLGSRSALWYLVAKGYVERRLGAPGPRGGERAEYRPVTR